MITASGTTKKVSAQERTEASGLGWARSSIREVPNPYCQSPTALCIKS